MLAWEDTHMSPHAGPVLAADSLVQAAQQKAWELLAGSAALQTVQAEYDHYH